MTASIQNDNNLCQIALILAKVDDKPPALACLLSNHIYTQTFHFLRLLALAMAITIPQAPTIASKLGEASMFMGQKVTVSSNKLLHVCANL